MNHLVLSRLVVILIMTIATVIMSVRSTCQVIFAVFSAKTAFSGEAPYAKQYCCYWQGHPGVKDTILDHIDGILCRHALTTKL